MAALLALAALGGCATSAGAELAASPAPGSESFADGLLHRESAGSAEGSVRPSPNRTMLPAEKAFTDPEAPEGESPGRADASRKLVHEAALTVEVARPEDEVDWLESRVAALGGYVVERRDTDVQLRVPVDEYERLLQEIRERGRVLSQQIRALDVTEQHRDLTIRLANARMSRERLLKLLETAEKVEDLLRIEKELQRLTTDIERLTAQLENLDLRVATSRIDVAFRARREPDPVVRPKQPSRFAWIRSIGAEHVLERF